MVTFSCRPLPLILVGETTVNIISSFDSTPHASVLHSALTDIFFLCNGSCQLPASVLPHSANLCMPWTKNHSWTRPHSCYQLPFIFTGRPRLFFAFYFHGHWEHLTRRGFMNLVFALYHWFWSKDSLAHIHAQTLHRSLDPGLALMPNPSY